MKKISKRAHYQLRQDAYGEIKPMLYDVLKFPENVGYTNDIKEYWTMVEALIALKWRLK